MAGLRRLRDGLPSRRHFLQHGFAAVAALIAVACSPSRPRSHRATTSVPATRALGTPPGVTRIDAGPVEQVRATIASRRAPSYLPQARGYVSAFPADLAERARGLYPTEVLPVLAEGLIVLHHGCPHLGCRVPFCTSSQWFECPCHAAKFDRIGEYRAGPAPRGMTLYGASIQNGRLVIDAGATFPGMPLGTNTTRQSAEGPACVGP